jgi:meiotic recombination protein SPO11
LSYQLPSRDLEQQEYDPLLRQVCLRRGKVDCCAVSDPKTSHWAKVITIVLSEVQKQLLSGNTTTSHLLCYGDKLVKTEKTVNDALLDICCLLECTRKSLNLYEVNPGKAMGELIFTTEDGKEEPVLGYEGVFVQQGLSNITVKPGKEAPRFILVVQGADVFEAVAQGRGNRFLREFTCVVVTAGDGQPDIKTRAFLRKLKDSLSVPIYALVGPCPEGLSIFCTYKYGSSEGPFDNAGLTVPDIELIGLHLGDALDLDPENRVPLTKEDMSILEGLCAKKYVMGDELLRTNIHFMMYRGLKSRVEALLYHQYPPIDYIRKAISNQEGI